MMATSQGKLVAALQAKIEERSGTKLISASGATVPAEEWIPETKMARTKAINLRTTEQTKNPGNVTTLQQFNPSFFLLEESELVCRVPGCSVTTPRLKACSESQHLKQDLFLCEIHRTKLASMVSKRCQEEGVHVSVPSYEHDDFHDYTSLIGELEKAFMCLMKKPATLYPRLYSNSNLVLAEVFLNARNFLTITHALLNPNYDNLAIVLPALLQVLQLIMDHHSEPEKLERSVRALREIMDIIMNCFGIIYTWVILGNPGAQFGGGAGFIIGGILGAITGPAGVVLGVVLGLIGGNLMGSGVYAWHQEQRERDRQNQREREYLEFIRRQFGVAVPRPPLYHVSGNPGGDLVLDVHYTVDEL